MDFLAELFAILLKLLWHDGNRDPRDLSSKPSLCFDPEIQGLL